MAELYLARASGLHGFEKLCVLKLVLPHLVEDRRFVEMFLQEARTAATLDHPNIAHVTDIGELEGEPFFVMQYVRGRDLRKVAKALGGAPLPLDVALTVASQVAAGLHYVHDRQGPEGKPLGLVHRDVSPANVMIGFDGDVKLVDFGIAKSTEQCDATRTGVIKGKVSYMAPEQCRGEAIDRRTDVFALGILLCEMTTGRRLFRGETDFAIMSNIVDGEFIPPRQLRPEYPEALEAIVLRALQRVPADRYLTAAAMQADLEALAQEQGLRLSTLTLSSFMRELFGEQPNAAGVDPLDEAPTEIHREARERPQVAMLEHESHDATSASASARPTVIEPPAPVEHTVVAELAPLPPGNETLVSSPMVPVDVFAAGEIHDELPIRRATGARLLGIAGVLAVAAAMAVFALGDDDDDGSRPVQPQTSPADPPSPVRVEVPVAHDDEPAEPPATAREPEVPMPPAADEPAPIEDAAASKDERPSKSNRSHRPRGGAKGSRGKTSGKRGRRLDDMYPS
jgi:serine/threonine protein kinase